MSKLKELENKIKEIAQELEELKNKKTDKWEPEDGEEYFYVNGVLDIDSSIYRNDEFDNLIIKNSKILETEEEAKDYANYLKVKNKYTHIFTREEWEDENIDKHYIMYNYKTEGLIIGYSYSKKSIGETYFKTKEKAQEFINKYEKEILKYEFDIEEE